METIWKQTRLAQSVFVDRSGLYVASMSSVWAPVTAGLGAGLITGAAGFGAIWWQQRSIRSTAQATTRAQAYQALIAHSLTFALRATTLRPLLASRSGLTEQIDVAVGRRDPFDAQNLHDWIAVGFDPLNEALTTIQVFGSLVAARLAHKLVDECTELMKVASDLGTAHGPARTRVQGMAWTEEQDAAMQTATERLMEARRVFIRLAREEFADPDD